MKSHCSKLYSQFIFHERYNGINPVDHKKRGSDKLPLHKTVLFYFAGAAVVGDAGAAVVGDAGAAVVAVGAVTAGAACSVASSLWQPVMPAVKARTIANSINFFMYPYLLYLVFYPVRTPGYAEEHNPLFIVCCRKIWSQPIPSNGVYMRDMPLQNVCQ